MAHQLPDPGASSTSTPTPPIARDSRRVTRFFSRSRDPHWNGNGFWVYPVLQDLAFTAEPSPLLLVDIMPPTEFASLESTKKNANDERRGMKAHPHVGYDTVTWVFQGQVEFQDCLVPNTQQNNTDHPATVSSPSVHKGCSSSRTDKVLLNPGDISWTSGPVWHAERHGPDFESGTMELIQLWINTPSTYQQESFTADGRSSHQVFSSQNLPTVPIYACSASETPTNRPRQGLLHDEKQEQSNCSRLMGRAQILAGTYHINNNENHSSINYTLDVVHGPAQTASPIQLWNFEFFVRTTRRRTTRTSTSTSIGDDDDDDDDTSTGSPDRIANTPNADSQKMDPSSTINNTPRDDEARSPSALPSADDDLPTNAPYFSFPPTDNKLQWIEVLYPSDQVAMILVRRGRIALLRSDNVQIIAGGGSADEQGLKQHAASSSMDSSSTPIVAHPHDFDKNTRIIQVGPQEMAVLDPLSSSYDLEETNAPASSVDQPPNTNASDNPSTQPVSSQSASSSSSLDTIRIGIFEEERTSSVLVGGRASMVNQPVVGRGPFLLSCWQDLSRAVTDFQQRTGIFARRPS